MVFSVILSINILNIVNQNSYSSIYYSTNSNTEEKPKKPNSSADILFNNIPWLENADFSSPTIDPWFNTTQGDLSDVEAGFSSLEADLLVLGDTDIKEISDVFIDTSRWTQFDKTEVDTVPDNFDVDPNGVWADHYYDEDANQFPSVYWRYNVSMGQDMSDFEITSASIDGIWNATVDRNFDVEGDTLAHTGDGINSRDLFDSIIFTIEVSNLELSPLNTYTIGDNRTTNLGDDEPVATSFLDVESSFNFRNEEDLKFYLTRVLESDPGHDNFTIILGISIICADNSDGGDIDEVIESRIRSLNLTFGYKKKIDIFSGVSWSQEGGMINYTSVQVTEAKLNFNHKINTNWTEATEFLAENSEIRFLINGFPSNNYPTIKLSTLQDTYQEAISGDYDVTNLIPLNESITLAIQVHLADDFLLDQQIKISIDNVKFTISYIVFNQTVSVSVISGGGGGSGKTRRIEEPLINLIIAIAAIAGGIFLGGYLIAYQLVLKYPKPVRKVRKYRKTLKKKKGPTVNITGKKNAFKEIFNTEIASIKGLFSSATSVKIAAKDKIVQKSLQISSKKLIKKSVKKPPDTKS